MKIDYTVQVWREGNHYVADAMPLDVASSGETPEGARRAADEAVRLFLSTAAERGTREQVQENQHSMMPSGKRDSGVVRCGPSRISF